MTGGKTNAETLRDAYYGAASPAGSQVNDHILLEISETNKVIASSVQARAIQAWLMMYAARVAHDNRISHWHSIEDPVTKEKRPEIYIKDNWAWMWDLYRRAMESQLTMLGYSREQFLRHAVAIANMGERPAENKSFWDLFQPNNNAPKP